MSGFTCVLVGFLGRSGALLFKSNASLNASKMPVQDRFRRCRNWLDWLEGIGKGKV